MQATEVPTKDNVTIYLDRGKYGNTYTIYVGKTCVGYFIGDEEEFEKYLAIIGGWDNIKEGLSDV